MLAAVPVQERFVLAEQLPPDPLQERLYAPGVETVREPDVAPPVLKPPPVQLEAYVEFQVRVDGTPIEGLALSEQVGFGLLTVME
jgi:hypothetical protein